MVSILRQLPIFPTETTALAPDGPVIIRSYQIIVWVSLSQQSATVLDPSAPPFPAILDIGNNHNFAIQEEHLNRWAGFTVTTLAARGRIQIAGRVVPLLGANVWIHRNQPGKRDEFTQAPFCLELEEGIAVYPRGLVSAPRLPLLGLRAIVRNGLHLAVNGKRSEVSLRS